MGKKNVNVSKFIDQKKSDLMDLSNTKKLKKGTETPNNFQNKLDKSLISNHS
jgi:hypothetical protein